MRKDKGEWANNIAQAAEHAAKHGQTKDATRKLCSKPPKKIDMVRNNTGRLLTQVEEVERTLRGSTEQAQPRTSGRCD